MDKQVIFGICPSKSNCYRIGQKGLFKTKALTDYEAKFYIQCRDRGKLISTYFEFYMDVYYPNERADLDNSCKIVLDSLQKCGVIRNDNKCVKLVINKFLDISNPRIEYHIKVIE